VRAPLARIRLQREAQRESLQLLGESRLRRAILSGDGSELLEALVLYLPPSWSCGSFLLRAEVRRLTRTGRVPELYRFPALPATFAADG